jgi:amino acid transporter
MKRFTLILIPFILCGFSSVLYFLALVGFTEHKAIRPTEQTFLVIILVIGTAHILIAATSARILSRKGPNDGGILFPCFACLISLGFYYSCERKIQERMMIFMFGSIALIAVMIASISVMIFSMVKHFVPVTKPEQQ